MAGTARTTADQRDLYLLDLSAHTIERAVRASGGGDANGSVGSVPAISDDGTEVAFTSDASNLFFGDANDRADAFLIRRQDAAPAEPAPPDAAQDTIETPDAPDAPAREDRLTVTVRRSQAGQVVLLVRAPRAGRVATVVRGRRARLEREGLRQRADARPGRDAGDTSRTGHGEAEAFPATTRSRLRIAGKLVAQADVRFVAKTGPPAARRVTVKFLP